LNAPKDRRTEEAQVVNQIKRIDRHQARPSIEQTAPTDAPWLLIGLTLAAVLPFWTLRYPVVTDYPNHLARWFVLFHMKDPAYHFAAFYTPAWGPLPYISPDILAMVLQNFLPIDVVGRCILSLCIILVTFGTYFFLKKACPENIELASFGVLVAFNPNFLMGSISNQFSLAFCLFVVGLWVSYCRSRKPITAVGIVIGLILVYLSHLIGFVVAGTVMGTYALLQKNPWKKVAILAVLSVPALLLLAYNFRYEGASPSFYYSEPFVWDKLRHLPFPVRLFTSRALDMIVLATLGFLIILVWKNRRLVALRPVWLTVCAVLLLIYFIAPNAYRLGGYADLRILPFLYLFLLAVWRFQRVPRYLCFGLALLVLFRVVTVEQMFGDRQAELRQLTASFEAIPRDSRVLQILPIERLLGRADIHHLDYGLIQRGFLVPTLFHIPGVQPIRLAGSSYCPNVLCNIFQASGVDWQQVANSYDYLWVHNYPEITTSVSQIGDVVFSNDSVTVYRVRHSHLQQTDASSVSQWHDAASGLVIPSSWALIRRTEFWPLH
jgi:hypothetical protein